MFSKTLGLVKYGFYTYRHKFNKELDILLITQVQFCKPILNLKFFYRKVVFFVILAIVN